jgi:hypothetical protein
MQAKQQYEAAANERDPQVREQKELEAKERLAAWDEGGRYRVAMHIAMGAAGAGWQGAMGAGAAAGAAPSMDKLQKNLWIGGGQLTMCRLASRAYEHWRGLLRALANSRLTPDLHCRSDTPSPGSHAGACPTSAAAPDGRCRRSR